MKKPKCVERNNPPRHAAGRKSITHLIDKTGIPRLLSCWDACKETIDSLFSGVKNSHRRIKKAEKIKGYPTNGPKVKLGSLVRMTELVKFISGHRYLNLGELRLVMNGFQCAVYFYKHIGCPIKIPRLGIGQPKVNLDGKITVGHRTDNQLNSRFHNSDGCEGVVLNSHSVGQSYQRLIDH